MSNRVEFTPMKGLLNVGDIIARRFGLGHIWDGKEGLREVAEEKLREVGVPVKSVALVEENLTPRQLVERVGFIKKRKRLK